MMSVRRLRNAAVVLLAATMLGCLPSGSSQSDEEKEPYFQTGRARVNGMDYGGAIEAFQKALEVNPHSGAANFELGWLFANKQIDPAAAIYHYERYLALRPKAENGDTIRQHILGLKQDLAKAVLPLPSTPAAQRQLEQLMEENRRLQEEIGRWRADAAKRAAAPPPNQTSADLGVPRVPVGGGSTVNPPRATGAQGLPQPGRPVQAPAPSSIPVAPTRTHKVQSGETPSSIAKKYNVKLEALQKVNPGVNPKRLQVGQSLVIPAS